MCAHPSVSEAPVLFLERKSHVMQPWDPDGPRQQPNTSSAWLDDTEGHMLPPSPLAEQEGLTEALSLPGHSRSAGATPDTKSAILLSSSAAKRVDIGDLRSLPLEDLAVFSGLLLQASSCRSTPIMCDSLTEPLRCADQRSSDPRAILRIGSPTDTASGGASFSSRRCSAESWNKGNAFIS